MRQRSGGVLFSGSWELCLKAMAFHPNRVALCRPGTCSEQGGPEVSGVCPMAFMPFTWLLLGNNLTGSLRLELAQPSILKASVRVFVPCGRKGPDGGVAEELRESHS